MEPPEVVHNGFARGARDRNASAGGAAVYRAFDADRTIECETAARSVRDHFAFSACSRISSPRRRHIGVESRAGTAMRNSTSSSQLE